jgi:hypothetical protein
MTKTFTTVVSYLSANAGLPVMMPMSTFVADHVFGILNFGH